MSQIENFIKDFPNRCTELLATHLSQAVKDGREVTFAIAIATAALTIPFERIRFQAGVHLAGDVEKYPLAKEQFDDLLKKRIFEFHPNGKDKTWRKISALKIDRTEIERAPDIYWRNQADKQEQLGDIDTNTVLSWIRNALSHGNIFTLSRGGEKGSEIETIVFASRRSKRRECKCQDSDEILESFVHTGEYNVLFTSPDDFQEFLKTWLNALSHLNLDVPALTGYSELNAE